MRKRWLVGTLAVLSVMALAGRVATLAQKPDGPRLMLEPVPSDSKEARSKGWRSAGDPLAKAGFEPAGLPAPSRAAEPAADDPMGAVDSFLHRNQKEADDSIKALAQEAEALRARLQKVESALARWKGVAQALDQQARSGVGALPAQSPTPGDPFLPGEKTPPSDPFSLPNPGPAPPPTSAPNLQDGPTTLPPSAPDPATIPPHSPK